MTVAVAYRTTVEATGKTATVLRVPAEVVAALGSRRRPPVRVAIGEHTSRSTVAVDGDWIDEAKRPETRQRRIAGTVERILAGTTQR